MSKREKLRRKLQNSQAGATLQEVESLLVQFGFSLTRVSGSHRIYEYQQGATWRQVVVPLHGRKVKKVYVGQVIRVIDDLFPKVSEERAAENDDEIAD